MISTKSSMVRAMPRVSPLKMTRPSQLVRRATPEDKEPENGTIFYAGETYTEQQWSEAVASGKFARPEPAAASVNQRGSAMPSLNEVMGFSGSAPEIVNGRLAMLGFVAAVAAEFSSGEGVAKQWSEEPTGIALTFILFMAASLVPAFVGRKDDKLGPFTPQAEMLNGRAAMIGFAALLVIEAVKGSPLF